MLREHRIEERANQQGTAPAPSFIERILGMPRQHLLDALEQGHLPGKSVRKHIIGEAIEGLGQTPVGGGLGTHAIGRALEQLDQVRSTGRGIRTHAISRSLED